MKQSLRPGLSKTQRLVVDRDRTIGFLGDKGRVYGTPNLVRDIELACRDLLIEHSDAGEDSVGMEVSVRHLAPTLLGMEVVLTITVGAVDGRKVSFDVSATDEIESICSGSHTRFVIDVNKTYERLQAKAAKRSARQG